MLNELIDKETTSKLLTEIYTDLAKPAVTEVGIALGTIFGLCNMLLMVIALQNEKAKLKVQHNLEIYRQKLNKIEKENIQEVIPEIGVPVIEKLLYVTDESLVDLYTELLAKASDKTQCNMAHPGFVNIINNLSPKEAQILKFIKKNFRIAMVEVSVADNGLSRPIEKISELILSEEFYDENTKAFLSNLIGLGVIEENNVLFADSRKYEFIHNRITEIYSQNIPLKYSSVLNAMKLGNFEFKNYSLRLTEFGDLFLSACTNERMRTDFYHLFYKWSITPVEERNKLLSEIEKKN